MTKVPYHQAVASQIIEQLKQGTAPWIKPWEAGHGGLPFNPVTGKRYKGINALYLMQHPGGDNRWLTYKQAQTLGAQVRKGEKGTTVQYWKFREERIKKDEAGQPVLGKDRQPVKIQVELERPKVFYATVFHASQIENMPEQVQKEKDWSLVERAEHLLINSKARMVHSETDRAFYRLSTDSIHLPPKEQFKSAAKYYATALHELGHWSGHPQRLNRDLSHPFGSEGYAKEELRAEIASMILGAELGIGHDPSQHTAYIKSWIRVLEDDPLEIFRASADAEKIVQHLFSLEQQRELEPEHAIETMDEQQNEPLVMEAKQNDSPTVFEPINTALSDDKKIWLHVPYHQKDEVKALAGTLEDNTPAIAWDKKEKKWYAKEGANLEVLSPWLLKHQPKEDVEGEKITEKTWLCIPFQQKNAAKSAVGQLPDGRPGLGWDKAQKCWYANPGVEIEKIKAWLPAHQIAPQEKALSPVDEFKEALIRLGAVVTGEHPIMDGKTHRIAMEGDRHGEKAGFYVAYLDGVPAGYIKNNRTGVELKWKSKGYVLTDEQKSALRAQALENQQHRERVLDEKHNSVALKLRHQLSKMSEAAEPTPYMQSKGISLYSGVFTDEEKKLTCIPAMDIEGNVWTVQYIAEDGTKRFAKDSKKEGCFHVLGGMEKLSETPVIVISEGYATAATIKEAADLPVVVSAFDAGNLKAVATALHEKYPHTPIVIAADDDRHLVETQKVNPGKDKAEEAAKEVNGFVILPVFAPGEQSVHPKRFSDFNDMAQSSRLGMEGVRRQVKPKIEKIAGRYRSLRQSQRGNVVRMA